MSGIDADLLVSVLKRATVLGATAADGFLVDERHFSATVRLGEVDTVTHSHDQRLSLRVFAGRASAAASTSDLSSGSLERVVEEATRLAKITAEDPHAGLPDATELTRSIPELDLADLSGHDLAPEAKIDIARRAEAAAMAADPRVTNSEGAEFWDRQARYAYATSARKRAALDDPAEVGRTAAARAVRRLGARKVKTTEVPVIFDPETAATLVRAIASAAAGPSLYRRASFLLDRLGTTIAAPSVTIVDDGLRPGGLGSRPFDGEGMATRRTVVVSEGVLQSYLLDSYSARKLGLASTHHAARDGAGVTVATTNLMLMPGSTSPQDLIASVREGLYVTELIGFGVNGVTGDYSRGAVGLWIENGAFAYPVEEVTIAGNLLEMFAEVDGIGNDLVLRERTAAPTVKIASMVVAGD